MDTESIYISDLDRYKHNSKSSVPSTLLFQRSEDPILHSSIKSTYRQDQHTTSAPVSVSVLATSSAMNHYSNLHSSSLFRDLDVDPLLGSQSRDVSRSAQSYLQQHADPATSSASLGLHYNTSNVHQQQPTSATMTNNTNTNSHNLRSSSYLRQSNQQTGGGGGSSSINRPSTLSFEPTTNSYSSASHNHLIGGATLGAASADLAGGAASYYNPKAALLSSSVGMQQQQQQQQQTTTTAHNSTSHREPRVQSSLAQLIDDMRQIEDTVDSIEIPARGRCKVFMAKYGYDPYKQSPNENPDNELAFNAGDYIMVFDDIDEDGYFIGELMDGRRGYVPSNWLDRLTGEDLFEFQASELYKQSGVKAASGVAIGGAGLVNADDEMESNSYPPEFYDAIHSDTMQHSNFQHLIAPEDYRRMNDYVNLDDVDEVDDECLSDYERAEAEQMRRAVPPPQKLTLERQLNKSILISWLHPEAAKGTIISYQVYVDGVLKSTVPSGDRTKALIEGVDSSIPHRFSVRAIDLSGRHSNDAGCTLVIGQNIPFAPSCVKASHTTSDSALISWLPCNSNFHHVVAVNSVEVQTVRPGVYKHLINGLSANTLYRVWVRAKPGKILSVDEKNYPKKLESLTTYVDFKTMPKSLPDPPVNVQVEAGPQRRTLLVTWLPLTLNNYGSSNGCPVTGYAVFAGHKKLADIDSPTGDHALLDLSDLESLHKKSVTVRTKSGENLSQDSMSCQIPDEYLKQQQQQLQHQHASKFTDSAHHQMISGVGSHSQHPHHHIPRSKLADGQRFAGHHSPSMAAKQQAKYATDSHNKIIGSHHHLASPRGPPTHQRGPTTATSMARGRQMARSLQNLESDLDSRRSSIPAIEITRDARGSDYVNYTESYSEEEFENSMRFRGVRGANRANAKHRARRYHSVDGSNVRHPASRSRGQLADTRYFVALFDYDPSTMSPNPNAAIEELAFKEGSIIKIIGDKGPDGFYRGELDGHVGFVPSNVVSEITDPNLLYSLHEKSRQQKQQQHQQQPPLQGSIQSLQAHNPQYGHQQTLQAQQQQQQQPRLQAELDLQQQQQQQQHPTAGGVKRMTALYDYNPQENSPNVDTESEIPFKTGDVIYVYGKMDTDGFYIGEVERTKQKGLVPSNFLREDPAPGTMKPMQQQPQQQQQQHQPTQDSTLMSTQTGLMSQGINDPMQQSRAQNLGQFMGGQVTQQQQQPQVGSMADGSMGAYGGVQQQQQNMNMMISNPQARGTNIRGVVPATQQQNQNINRPSTLSLNSNFNNPMGPTNDWMSSSGRQMPQQQPMGAMNTGNLMQQQQQPMMGSNTTMQQQQQQPGGMLSNLLSSGKQMINAATPRAQNQPGQFPSVNQIGGGVAGVGGGGGGVMGMGAMGTMGAMNSTGNMMGDHSLGPMGGDASIGNFATNRTGNIMQLGNQMQQPNLQQQNPHQQPFQMQQQQQHQPQQQQQQPPMQSHQQFNQGNFMRGAMNQATGEDQGGNILNTVKNMFKL